MNIYISGPMSGIKDYNYPAFNQIAELLRANGHKVYNPAEISPPLVRKNKPVMTKREIWIWYMKKALTLMLKADVVVLLPGWKKSKGACLEVYIAGALDYRIIEESELVELGIIF